MLNNINKDININNITNAICVKKYDELKLKELHEIQEIIGENNNLNVNEKFDYEKIIDARKNYYEKNIKKKEPLNSITNSTEEERVKKESLKKLNVAKTDDFELKTKKQIEQEKEEREEYEKYLNKISAKTNLNGEEFKKSFDGLKADYKRELITKRCNIINESVNLAKKKDAIGENFKGLILKRGIKIGSLRDMLKHLVKYDLKKENKFNFNIYGKSLEFNNVAEIFDYVNKLYERIIERFKFFKENTRRIVNLEDKLLQSEDLVFKVLFKKILKKENEYLDVLVKLKKYLIYLRNMESNFSKNEKSDYDKIFKKDFEDAFIKYSMLNIVNLYENFSKHHPVDFNEYSQELLTKPELETEKTYNNVSIKNYGKIKPIID